MTHTPGPWKASTFNQIVTDGDLIIATAVNKKDQPILTAAPEMYEAIRWLLHLCSGVSKGGSEHPVTHEEWSAAWEAAVKAIKKADGSKGG